MTRAVCVALVTLVFVAPAAAKPAKPKPWAWTTAQAATQLKAANLEPFGSLHLGTLTVTKCAGKGKAVARHYMSFSCSATWTGRGIDADTRKITVWAKVRPVGKGQPCISVTTLAAVPKVCLAKGVRTAGDTDDATNALTQTLGDQLGTSFPYQGPTECASFGASFFACWFGANGEPTDPGMGHATVVLAAQPIVRVIDMPATG